MDKLFSLFVKPKSESRRDFFIFLVGIFFFCLSFVIAFWAVYVSFKSGETMAQLALILTFVFLGLGILVGIIAIWFYIWSRRNPIPDPLEKMQETLQQIQKRLKSIDTKLRKLNKK